MLNAYEELKIKKTRISSRIVKLEQEFLTYRNVNAGEYYLLNIDLGGLEDYTLILEDDIKLAVEEVAKTRLTFNGEDQCDQHPSEAGKYIRNLIRLDLQIERFKNEK